MSNDPKDVNIDLSKLKKPQSYDRLCDSCIKEDVCSIKNDLQELVKKVGFIEMEHNVTVDINIKCSKWFGKTLSRQLNH